MISAANLYKLSVSLLIWVNCFGEIINHFHPDNFGHQSVDWSIDSLDQREGAMPIDESWDF